MLTRITRRTPEIILLCMCFAPYIIFPREIPTISMQRHDNIVIGEFTYNLLRGASIFSLPDPYFRYVPQTLIATTLSPIVDWNINKIIMLNAYYTIFIEGVLTPLLLYIFAARVRNRLVGIVTLGVTAIFHIQLLPWHPNLTLGLFYPPAESWGCAPCTLDILGASWYFTFWDGNHWQYTFALPFVITTLLFTAQRERERWKYAPYVAGIALGIAGSLQVIQGLFAALIVAIALLYKQELGTLLRVSATSIVVASPNVIVILNHPSNYFGKGADRASLGTLSNVITIEFLILGLISTTLLIGLSWWFVSHWSVDVFGLAEKALGDSAIPAVWICFSGAIGLIMMILGAYWYRILALSLFHYALYFWVASGGVTILSTVMNRYQIRN